MDSFAKRYLAVLTTVVVATLAWLLLNGDDRVDALNARLAGDAELAGYPYTFRVWRIENNVAVMGSPRSAEVSVMQFLRTAFPELSRSTMDDPAMMAAQLVLAEKQARAQQLVTEDPDVSAVRWELDERWFNEKGVFLNY